MHNINTRYHRACDRARYSYKEGCLADSTTIAPPSSSAFSIGVLSQKEKNSQKHYAIINQFVAQQDANMATAEDLQLWKAFGGCVEERTSGKRTTKVYIAPNGKKFRSMKEASAFMKVEEAQESQGRKRVHASPDIIEDKADNAKKRVKTDKSSKSVNKPSSKQGKDKSRDTALEATKQQNQQHEVQAAEPMDEDKQEQPADAEDSRCEAGEDTQTAAASRSGRLAAQGKQYKEGQVGKVKASEKLQVKVETDADSEADAVEQTKTEKSSNMRRLLHFAITSEDGEMQSLDRVELLKEPLKLSGAVYPETGPLSKESGRMVSEPFGPITSWYVSYNSTEPVLVACTSTASYQLSKPAQAYKKVHAALEEQATLTWHVLQALDQQFGGDPAASLDAVVAKLARAKAGKGYSSAREALLLNGRFVLNHVMAHDKRNGGAAADDKGKGKAPAGFSSGPFCTELQAELAKGPIQVGVVSGNAITIKDKPAAGAAEDKPISEDALTAADEDMARRLQAKMDAQQYKAAGNKGRGHGSAAPYIKISEAEIADDYPMPQQYKAPDGVEETDELLLWDEELADCDPEYLPKRLLTDFSIYNAEGFFASLELLPLWSGVDPDVELFASGIVKDEEGDWGTGGQPLELRHEKQQQQDGVKKQQKPSSGSDDAAAAAAAPAAGGSSSAAGGSSTVTGGSSAAATARASGSSGAGGSSSAAGVSGAAEEPVAAEPSAEAAAEDVAEEDGPDPVAEGGMRLYLSQIREWVVEYSADMLFISIRTDAAWYKLCRPNKKYKPWYGVPLKSARVAVKVIHALSEQSRVSRLSFNDVVKMLADAPQDSSTFISKRADRVERYLVVHGQILLNQIKAYPNQAVQRSQFVTGLKAKMEMRKHSKLYYTKKGAGKAVKGVQRNPMKDRAPSARAKPMPATATTMVRSIWQNYFYSMDERDDAVNKQKAEEAAAQGVAQEVEDDPLEEEEQEDGDAQENALAGPGSPSKKRPGASSSKSKKAGAATKAGGKDKAGSKAAAAAADGDQAGKQHAAQKVTWVGKAHATEGRQVYAKAKVGSWTVEPGTIVLLEAEQQKQQDDAEQPQQQHLFAMVQCMWQDEDGDKMAQVRVLISGAETVLGDAGSEAELFMTDDFEDVLLSEVQGLVTAKRLTREFDPDLRVRHFEEDEALRKRNAAAKAAGKPLEYFYRHLYLPEQGMFKGLPENLNLGVCREEPPAPIELAMTSNKKGFIMKGTTYNVGDFLFVLPGTFDCDVASPESADEEEQSSESDEEEQDDDKENKPDTPSYMKKKSRFHKGSIDGLKAWGIARLLEVKEEGSSSRGANKDKKDTRPSKIKVQRFYRPEDISQDQAYKANFWDVYATPKETNGSSCQWVQWIDVDDVVQKCAVKAVRAKAPEGAELLDVFEVVGTYNPTTEEVTAAPEEFAEVNNQAEHEEEDEDYVAMASMDIFAGCGGLSEGMHQAKVADTKWAIEYERPAADAFQLNNPDAAVFCDNCNVILLAAMQKAGLEKDASACEDARTAAAKMSAEDIARLPLPGDVEFIMGGPPCQGYSGMNRFNKGNWSMVQNSMVMSYLSFADFYRPRYFLLENVRNFVSHNKSFTFRLTLRTLLDMGYQVRFGVLNAGNFGVSQSRKRTFIWAAAPQERLPEWPRPKHVFRSPQLTVNLPGGVAYCAVDTSVPGGPLRTVTVRDAIGDLPPIENGHSLDVMDYTGPPASAFQRCMRSQAKQLRDHICKEMNPLNLERCRCIPKDTPGADWRVLVNIVKSDPSREKYQGQPLVPWCLPNTAARHNGWRGLFGRLDLDGHFPTSTTDPQPMGKVGQVFHPNQDRIVSVRECARSQGFPDHFLFSGNVHARHRQVGNAVPPPLAASLGRQLYKALQQTHKERKVLF